MQRQAQCWGDFTKAVCPSVFGGKGKAVRVEDDTRKPNGNANGKGESGKNEGTKGAGTAEGSEVVTSEVASTMLLHFRKAGMSEKRKGGAYSDAIGQFVEQLDNMLASGQRVHFALEECLKDTTKLVLEGKTSGVQEGHWVVKKAKHTDQKGLDAVSGLLNCRCGEWPLKLSMTGL
jgi:hypothetical protein